MRTLYIIDCGVPEKGAIHYSSTSFLLVSNFLLWNILHCYRNLYYKVGETAATVQGIGA